MSFPDNHRFPTDITATNPVVVTSADHGLTAGQRVRASNFFVHPSEFATGMEQLNFNLYVVANPTTDTFDLYDLEGQPIDGTGFTPFVNNGLPQFTLTGPDLFIENEA